MVYPLTVATTSKKKKSAKAPATTPTQRKLTPVGYRLPGDVLELLETEYVRLESEAHEQGRFRAPSYSEIVARCIRETLGK